MMPFIPLTIRQHRFLWLLVVALMACLVVSVVPVPAQPGGSGSATNLDVQVTKRGLGKQALLRDGTSEWFMLVDVTPENTVVIRQEQRNGVYLVDESETHDHPMSGPEVDGVIQDFINSVKSRLQRQ